jgi:hypothetical protein
MSRIFWTSKTAPVSWVIALVTSAACFLTALSTSQSHATEGYRLREIGAILLAVADGLIVMFHIAHLIYYSRAKLGTTLDPGTDQRGKQVSYISS